VPIFKNYLSSYYNTIGNFKQAYSINELTVKEHPNYLFGKVNYASNLIGKKEFEKVTEILGKSLLLHELYPERNEFLVDEIFTYYAITIDYLFSIDNDDEATHRIAILEDLFSDYYKIDKLQTIRQKHIHNKALLRYEKEEKNKVNVIEINRISHLQTTKLPKFNFPEQMALLYSSDVDKIDLNFLEEFVLLDKAKVVEDLITALKDSMYRFDFFLNDFLEESSTWFLIHILLILNYLEDEKAFDTVLEISRQHEEYMEFWFGYESSEYIIPYLYQISKNIDDELVDFLKEENISAYNKSEISAALVKRNLKETANKEIFVKKIEDVLDFLLENTFNLNILDSTFNAFFIADIAESGELKFLPKIKQFFDLNIVDITICGDLEEVTASFTDTNHKKEFKKYNSITEMYEDFFNMNNDFNLEESLFDDSFNKTPKLPIESNKKIGRNEPCFCGSGKKYKKCCINL
jgi:hypothetical protein